MALRSATICFADATNVRGTWSFTEPQIGRAEHQSTTPQRPAIAINRWQEDWSVLADLRVQRQPFDEFKDIPLFDTDRYTYLSFGVDTCALFEGNDAAGFGTGSRNGFHADLRVANQLQAFV